MQRLHVCFMFADIDTTVSCKMHPSDGQFNVAAGLAMAMGTNTLVIKHGRVENPQEVLIGKSPVNGPFSIAMFDSQRVAQRLSGSAAPPLSQSFAAE